MNQFTRKLFSIVIALGMALGAGSALAHEEKVHRVVMQLNDNDPKRMNMVLNNASNLVAYYQDKGEPLEIEIVAYGPGLNMLLANKSPVKQRIISFEQNFDNVSFMACNNTMKKMAKKSGKPVQLLSMATVVPAGVVHIMERQEGGWSYVRP